MGLNNHRTSAPLSIAYFSPNWPVTAIGNGIVTYVAAVAPALQALGHQVTILAHQVMNDSHDESVYHVGQVSEMRSVARRVIDPLWYRIAPRAAFRSTTRKSLVTASLRACAERGIQLIEMEESFGWARWVREATTIPMCVRLHGPWFLNGTVLGVPEDAEYHERVQEEGTAIRLAHAISAPSSNVLEQVRRFYGLDLPAAEVIPAPTPLVPVPARWQFEACDPKQVVFVGRFDRHKGGDLIIQAYRRVVEVFPEARLCFVGPDRGCRAADGRTWRLEDFIHDQIPGALESGRVEWLGPLPFPELAVIRRRGMVIVVCSRYENFPLTVVEAMALGCPTVAANTGGIPEILQDGVNGLLHRPEDPDDIAAKIIQLMGNPPHAIQLGQQAAADCERRFSPEAVANRLVEFYRQIISRTEARACDPSSREL